MTPENLSLLKRLLEDQRVLALSILVEGEPHASLLPYALTPDFETLLVHASGLARHTRGLTEAAPFAVVIHEPDRPDVDPLQLPRVTLQGNVQPVARGTNEYDAARSVYLAKFPQSEVTFSLGDFNVYGLRIVEGRLVGGFARASSFSAATLRELAHV